MFYVRFWGVRGSVPCPGSATVIYGGNTACVEIRAGERLIIIDMGTGIRPLGERLRDGDYVNGPVNADVFVTHTHWDHIMGFPMFSPLFDPATKLHVYGPVSEEEGNLGSIIDAHFSHRYWPVKISEVAAKIEYTEIGECSLDLGDGLSVRTQFLNHSLICLGYRFEYEGKSIATLYDHELVSGENEAADAANAKIQKFVENADILIHDSQYTADEFQNHIGWGHSSYEAAFNTAAKSKVKKLVFFHHDPNRNDAQLEALEEKYAALGAKDGFEAMVAKEGLVIEV